MTLSGTNTYVIDCGDGNAICIDPGPVIERHVEMIVQRADAMNIRIAAIAVTHGHPDHAPAAELLATRTGAPVYSHAGASYAHDRDLHEGEAISVGAVALQVVDAPGHARDHVAFYEPGEAALFTGDVVLGHGFVVVAPPGGAMRPYQRTLERLLSDFSDARTIYGGHGEPVTDPREKLREYIEHRRKREAQILDRLTAGEHTIPQLVEEIYVDTDRVLWPVAARQVLAHLMALEDEGNVQSRVLDRALTPSEAALLNPDWETIAGHDQIETARAEIGASLEFASIRSYQRL